VNAGSPYRSQAGRPRLILRGGVTRPTTARPQRRRSAWGPTDEAVPAPIPAPERTPYRCEAKCSRHHRALAGFCILEASLSGAGIGAGIGLIVGPRR